MLYHAGAIAVAAHDLVAAARRLRGRLEANPTCELAGQAREFLARIEGSPPDPM